MLNASPSSGVILPSYCLLYPPNDTAETTTGYFKCIASRKRLYIVLSGDLTRDSVSRSLLLVSPLEPDFRTLQENQSILRYYRWEHPFGVSKRTRLRGASKYSSRVEVHFICSIDIQPSITYQDQEPFVGCDGSISPHSWQGPSLSIRKYLFSSR